MKNKFMKNAAKAARGEALGSRGAACPLNQRGEELEDKLAITELTKKPKINMRIRMMRPLKISTTDNWWSQRTLGKQGKRVWLEVMDT